MADWEVKTRRSGRVQYERLIETGSFSPGGPTKLIGRQLIVAEPQGSERAYPRKTIEYPSRLGQSVELTDERRAHILTRHPAVAPFIERIRDVLAHPEAIRRRAPRGRRAN